MGMRVFNVRIPDSLRNDFLDKCTAMKQNPSRLTRDFIRKWTYEKEVAK